MRFSDFSSISPFADKLGTNYIPSLEEISEIRGLLMDPTEELGRIQARIDEMEVIVGQLKAKHSLLKTVIDAHQALISPIRRASEDVLREIFLACLPTAHNAIMHPSEAPILLSRICSHWRAIAHNTPMLWRSMHISLPFVYDGHHSARLEVPVMLGKVLEQWLERSATCSLDVSLSDASLYESHPHNQPIPHHPIYQLVGVCRRLRHLTLVGRPFVLLPLLAIGSESLPLLKSLRVRTTDSGAITDYQGMTNALQSASLTDISLSVTVDPLLLPLQWSQLTSLNLSCFRLWTPDQEGGLDGIRALEILRRCPNLLRCKLRMTRDEDAPVLTSDTSPLILADLHTLIFRGEYRFHTWIPHLHVPKLRCLQVGEARHTRRFTGVPIQDASMRAELDTAFFASSSPVLELLHSLPTISHLQLYSSGFSDLSLVDDAFLMHLHGDDLCPMLTHVTFTPEVGTGLSDTAVLAFIRARMGGPTPLHHVEVNFLQEMEIDIMPELRPFISDGLQVTLNYPELPRWELDARAGLDEPYWE
jgi:hypothetical protein